MHDEAFRGFVDPVECLDVILEPTALCIDFIAIGRAIGFPIDSRTLQSLPIRIASKIGGCGGPLQKKASEIDVTALRLAKAINDPRNTFRYLCVKFIGD